MGFKQSLICSICNYKSFTSAGPDRGFLVSTNTFLCRNCKTLNDLVVRDSRIVEGELSIEDYEKWKNTLKERIDLFSLMEDEDDRLSDKRDYPTYEQWKEQQENLRKSISSKKCFECGSQDLEIWDNKTRPCPNCGAKLQSDPNGLRMNWD